MSKWREWQNSLEGKKKIGVISGAAVIFIIICGVAIAIFINTKSDEVIYKEAKAQVGLLAAGVTETGSVDVGTTTQSFELDISQFTGEGSYSLESASFGMGGMDMMGSIGNSDQSSSSSSRSLEIEEVYVEAGEEIAKGSPLLKLTEDSVESIRSQLEEDADSAQIVYEQAVTANQQIEVEAESTYKINTLYGKYSESEYSQTVKELQAAVEEKQEALAEVQKDLTETQEELSQKEELLIEQQKVLENAEFTEKGTDKRENLYWWVIAWQTKEDAGTMVETLEEEIKTLKDTVESYEKQIDTAQTELSLAQKDLEIGILEAENQRSLREFNAENAQEIYDVATLQGAFDMEKAQADYEEAKEKLEEFDKQIVDQVVYASVEGLVTEVYVATGDSLTQNMDLISMNDYDAVTITLSITEDDMDAAQIGNRVNVTVAAFPDEVFIGEVTEIGDAEIDSNTNKTLYAVTVKVQNTGKVFYQDMTAEITFLTEETSEVLFVPDRAIVQDGEKTYVIVKNDDGTKENREVIIGISDGINTEIKEGLSEGEKVLWESRVGKA